MLHFFFKWRYERRARSGAFKLPKASDEKNPESANLSSYLGQSETHRHRFKPFDLPRKRRKWMQIVTVLVGICLVLWIAYESVLALALMGK
ncbi:MAG: hypothetical protein AAF065_03650 [Verrucomicrobiota bacterium]